MCGIVGVLSKHKFGLYNNQVSAFQHLLIADQVRGIDGTGVFWHNKKRESQVKKVAGSAMKLLGDKGWNKTRSDILFDSFFVVGHNRYSTKGGNSWQNTHPFKEGHITLVHNGTLYSHKHLKDVEVDSHAICHSIAEIGVEETLNKINGAFTLVWYDEKQQKVFFIRNKDRPLCLIETDESWFIASEESMLNWVLDRNKLKVLNVISDIPIHTLFCYDVETRTLTSEELNIKPKYPISTSYNDNNYGGYGNYYEDYYTNYSKETKALPAPKKDVIVKPNQNSGKITLGERVEFLPFSVKNIGKGSFYIEGYVYLNDESEIQVRYYNKDENYLEQLCIESALSGVVFQEAIISQAQQRYYVVKDVERIPTSINGTLLVKETTKYLPSNCTSCSSLVSKVVDSLKQSHIEYTKHRGWSIFCPDCTKMFHSKKKQAKEIIH